MSDKQMNLFIVTQDVETKEWLLSKGFKLVSESENNYVFVNKPMAYQFTNEDKRIHKFWYSNIIVI